MNSNKKYCINKIGMTLVEILIVVSLISLTGIAIYKSLSMGIMVWKRNISLVIEEDVVIFFDKLSSDLRNTFDYAKLPLHGKSSRFSFPTIVYTRADSRLGLPKGRYHYQIGKAEYFFDPKVKKLYRREANYSQSLKGRFGAYRELAHSIDEVRFRYYYITEDGEKFSDEVLETIPSGVEVQVMFSDIMGKRKMRKFIDIPVGG